MTNIIKFKKRTKSKQELYMNGFIRATKSIKEGMTMKEIDAVASKMSYYGIMAVNDINPYDLTFKELQRYFEVAQVAKGALSLLTYKQLQQNFPIDKIYNGEKSGWKDYFYSRDVVNKYNPEVVIKDNIDDLLWDYMSDKLFEFQAQMATIMSQLLRMQGKKGIAEQVFEDAGIDTYTLKSDGELVRNERKPNLRLV